MTNVRDFGALNWVKDEIDATIGQARRALEEQVDDAGSGASLQLCAESLHQIAGVLQMVEAYGPAMLAEEMEQVARAMFKRKVRQHEDAAEALMLALIQLPDYLEKLQAGDEDVPLIVLPLLNDLRAVRDAPLLSEAALFNPDLENVAVPDRITGEPNDELPDLVRRVRQKYHLGLLNWYRKLNLEKGWSYLLDVAKELERGAGTEQVHRLMWVAGAVIQGLIEGSIQGGVAVKQLLGKLDRELRLIIDQGERALVDDPPHELIKNLLYYVGRAESQHPHLLAVKEAYNLSGVLPSESALAKGRESLTGTNAELVHSVREAIYAELTQVKDILDLFMRGEQADPSTLDRLQVPMQRLADTLGMIGQGALRSRLIRQAEKLESFAKRSSKPEEFELMEMAGDILFVESSLSGIHSGQQLIEDVEASSS
ncbi:hypothetical protein QQ73_02370, partial [Candidatus Endoriftia persephone str. Guaymas]|nr:hypothetical protein [Candidatus Endoriftia persephone str. Guaymas]